MDVTSVVSLMLKISTSSIADNTKDYALASESSQ